MCNDIVGLLLQVGGVCWYGLVGLWWVVQDCVEWLDDDELFVEICMEWLGDFDDCMVGDCWQEFVLIGIVFDVDVWCVKFDVCLLIDVEFVFGVVGWVVFDDLFLVWDVDLYDDDDYGDMQIVYV